jgi:ribonucleotide monophosphatase NagD (HAD superfamily)
VTDVYAGINAGLKTVLVKTGNGAKSFSILKNENNLPSFVAENLTEACKFIINDSNGVTFSD